MSNVDNDLEKVEGNFKGSKEQVQRILEDKEEARKKMDEAFSKASENKGDLEEVWDYIELFFSISKDYINGTYREVPQGSIVAITGALLYLLSPIDLISDYIPVVGLIDDAFVIGLVFKQVKADLDKYEIWKNAQNN